MTPEMVKASFISPTLHKEILEFEKSISKYRELNDMISHKVVDIINNHALTISPGIEVRKTLNIDQYLWIICHKLEHALE